LGGYRALPAAQTRRRGISAEVRSTAKTRGQRTAARGKGNPVFAGCPFPVLRVSLLMPGNGLLQPIQLHEHCVMNREFWQSTSPDKAASPRPACRE
jgi:hypothetical protein